MKSASTAGNVLMSNMVPIIHTLHVKVMTTVEMALSASDISLRITDLKTYVMTRHLNHRPAGAVGIEECATKTPRTGD